MSGPGEFFSAHRKAIDARKAHLSRVGITPPDTPPLRDAMPSQADLLTMPTGVERPILDGTHAPLVPAEPPKEYAPAKLPKLLGVNSDGRDPE